MKKILMIATGGTIASKGTADGLAPELTSQDILHYIPSLKDICEVETLQLCNLDSTNISMEHWMMMEACSGSGRELRQLRRLCDLPRYRYHGLYGFGFILSGAAFTKTDCPDRLTETCGYGDYGCQGQSSG